MENTHRKVTGGIFSDPHGIYLLTGLSTGMASEEMDLKAEELRLIDLLGENTCIFKVPIFQREYKWEEEQRAALWNDIITIGGDHKASHFVGQVILVEGEEQENVNTYKIVDGQQRLTTFSILVCAIRDVAGLSPDQKNVESILTTYDRKGDAIRTLHLLESDNDAFRHIYEGNADQVDSDQPLRECYDYYAEKVSNLNQEEREDLLANTVHNINLVRTTCGSMTAAYQVFQTQNERGLSLSPINLSKTKLLEEASKAELDEKNIRNRWEEISTRLEDNELVSSAAPRRAITHYLIVDGQYQANGRITTKDFYATFTNALENHKGPTEIREFVTKLEDYTDRYIDLHEGTVRKYRRNKRSLLNKQMRFFQSKNAHAPVVLLYLVENVEDTERMESLLRLANKLNVRLNLDDANPAHHRDSMYQLVDRLTESDEENWESEVEDLIKERTVGDDQLFEILKARELPSSKFTRNMLLALEEDYYRASTPETQLDPDHVELEHIAPRRSMDSDSYSAWQAVFNNNKEKFEIYKSRLGNLTLLADKQNARASNDSFDKKCAVYSDSEIHMTNSIPGEYDRWGFAEIENRTEKLANDIINFWGVDN